MAKVKSAFYCQNCGAQYSKWQGQCNSCKSWNTIAEELIQTFKKREIGSQVQSKKNKGYPSL